MKVKRIKYAEFEKFNGGRAIIEKKYALYEEGKGYIAFSCDRRFGFVRPYIPVGGRKALQEIIDNGGFVSMDGMEYVMPVREMN